jgi:hypothetical protein
MVLKFHGRLVKRQRLNLSSGCAPRSALGHMLKLDQLLSNLHCGFAFHGRPPASHKNHEKTL